MSWSPCWRRCAARTGRLSRTNTSISTRTGSWWRGLVGLAHRDLRYQPLEDLPVDGRNLDPRRPVFCLKVRFVPQEERPVPLRVHRLQSPCWRRCAPRTGRLSRTNTSISTRTGSWCASTWRMGRLRSGLSPGCAWSLWKDWQIERSSPGSESSSACHKSGAATFVRGIGKEASVPYTPQEKLSFLMQAIRLTVPRSHGSNVVGDGSPSRIRMVRRISLGMTTRPRSSMRRTIPVAFIHDSSHISPAGAGQSFHPLPWKTWIVSADIGKVYSFRAGFVCLPDCIMKPFMCIKCKSHSPERRQANLHLVHKKILRRSGAPCVSGRATRHRQRWSRGSGSAAGCWPWSGGWAGKIHKGTLRVTRGVPLFCPVPHFETETRRFL